MFGLSAKVRDNDEGLFDITTEMRLIPFIQCEYAGSKLGVIGYDSESCMAVGGMNYRQ